ncbi:hypothetical protein ABW19_dt0201334 [Dactylella cylindrospora]|nr:hypothetical protein ABW19_dt0201334 [Dactylella cylindrospora]
MSSLRSTIGSIIRKTDKLNLRHSQRKRSTSKSSLEVPSPVDSEIEDTVDAELNLRAVQKKENAKSGVETEYDATLFNPEFLPFDIFQIIIDKLVVEEELWRSLELRRLNSRWNEAILRSICFTGVLDPLSKYGFDGYRSGTYHLTYKHKFPNHSVRGSHWHIVPVMHRVASSPRYAMNSLTLTIRKAADRIEEKYNELLPAKKENMKLMSEIMILVTELGFWDSFMREGEPLAIAGERFTAAELNSAMRTSTIEHIREAQAIDLALGIAVYSGRAETFRYIIHNLPAEFKPEDMILTAIVAAAYRGNLVALEGMLGQGCSVGISNELQTHREFIHADHWSRSFQRWLFFAHTFSPISMVLCIAAAGSQRHVIDWATQERFKKQIPKGVLGKAVTTAKDPEIVKILWAACERLSNADSWRMLATRAAYTAAALGDVEIVEFMISKGANPRRYVSGVWHCEEAEGPRIRLEYLMNVAAIYGRKNVVEMLLKKGVDPHLSATTDGYSLGDAMICSIRKGRMDIVQLLLDYGYYTWGSDGGSERKNQDLKLLEEEEEVRRLVVDGGKLKEGIVARLMRARAGQDKVGDFFKNLSSRRK